MIARPQILIYFDPVFLDHNTGDHPENASRLLPTVEHLDSLVRAATDKSYVQPNWSAATRERIQRVHAPKYIDELKAFADAGGGYIESDTAISEQSFLVALMATGAVCDAVERIDRQEDDTAFCLVRPPGHHAMPAHAMGFCLFNNVAVAARVATNELDYERVLIVDWDVHHGNGTQAIFWEDPKVAYFSIHRDPFYPFTGTKNEVGAGAGLGTTKNLPIQFGTSRQQQLQQFKTELTKFADEYQPQLVFISAGFDAHKDDPIGSLGLNTEDFGEMTSIVKTVAAQHAEGKIISVLEGGYNPDALAQCVKLHLATLSEN